MVINYLPKWHKMKWHLYSLYASPPPPLLPSSPSVHRLPDRYDKADTFTVCNDYYYYYYIVGAWTRARELNNNNEAWMKFHSNSISFAE